jgi:hypothetical protein
MNKFLSLNVLFLSFSTCLAVQVPDALNALTIYNDNFAVVKSVRQFDFTPGPLTIRAGDIAATIDPATARLECLSSPANFRILEQRYEYDYASTETLLRKYAGKNVQVTVKGSGSETARDMRGQLVWSRDQDITLKTGQEPNAVINILDRAAIQTITLAQLPAELYVEPTLIWQLESNLSGPQQCQLSYIAGEIKWNADYNAILDSNESHIDLSGNVTIENKTGTDFKNAAIQLVAGQVRRTQARRPGPVYYDMAVRKAGAAMAAAPENFEERAVSEYHSYMLNRTSSINSNETKQIEFLPPANNIAVQKQYIFDRKEKQDKVQVKFEFKNSKENRLGMPLPSGEVKVFTKDPNTGMLTFLGEDVIKHTAGGEKLTLYIGDAFDIVPEYTLLESRTGNKERMELHKIELRNHKNVPVTVFVDEKFPTWVNWQITENSQDYAKKDAYTARFTVKIPADSNAVLQYRAMQNW